MSIVLDKMAKTAHTWNGAISYSTTGTGKYGAILDYWAKAGTYQGREQSEVDADMVCIFSDDEETALAVVFGLRLITRKPDVEGIQEAQTGYGRKDEFFKAFLWLVNNRPEPAAKNLHLIPVFGSWKDFLQPPLLENLTLRPLVYDLFKENLGDDLLRKFLPTIYSKGKKRKRQSKWVIRCHTEKALQKVDWAKGFCKHLGISYTDYRKLKTAGEAHHWQQQMTHGEWKEIEFSDIPGRAMLHHTSRKNKKDKLTVFERHGQLERLKEWVLKQPTIKFTGYPYELTRVASSKKHPSIVQKLIYDRQFETVLEPMKGHQLGNVLACLDISGSMTSEVVPSVSAYDICLSMGIAFSFMNTGHFKDSVCGFSDSPIVAKLHGGMTDRLHYIETNGEFQRVSWGSTNFQGVIDLLVDIRKKNPQIPVEEFPETLLVISDMQFNPAGKNKKTNYEMAMKKLNAAGLGDMRIIWWYVNGQGEDFPVQMNEKGMYLVGGFDPNNLKSLMGLSKEKKDFVAAERKEETPLDGLMNFLRQPIFGLLQR